MQTKTDLPYYHGQPVEIATVGWLALTASVAVAFALLIALPFQAFPLSFIPVIAFTGIPLAVLALVSHGHQAALFGRFGLREFALAIGFGLLTIVISFVAGAILIHLTPMATNPTVASISAATPVDIVTFLVRTGIQLVGEELLTVLPLLAILWLSVQKLGLSRRTGLVLAVVLSTLIFAAVHLPTYNWNLIQCFGGIGIARIVLTAAFLVTRNLWVSAGAHMVNDWTELLLPWFLAGHVPIDAGT